MAGWIQHVTESPGLQTVIDLPQLRVSLLRLAEGERAMVHTGPAEETALCFASGRCSATAAGRFWATAGTPLASAPWMRFAQGTGRLAGETAAARQHRRTAAEYRPLASTTPWPLHQALRVGPATPVELQALEPAEVVLLVADLDETAARAADRPPELYGGEDNATREVGTGAFRRLVADILVPGVSSIALAVGETYNPPGGWSTYPPHRHDRLPRRGPDGPAARETQHQEVYLFRFTPPGGFGLARLYSGRPAGGGDDDQALVFKHGDALAIPGGFHTVCGAPGYHLHYLWALAGPRASAPSPLADPQHAWVLEAGA